MNARSAAAQTGPAHLQAGPEATSEGQPLTPQRLDGAQPPPGEGQSLGPAHPREGQSLDSQRLGGEQPSQNEGQPLDVTDPSEGQPLDVTDSGQHLLAVHSLGRVRYADALDLQRCLVDEIYRGDRGHTILFVEHDPVITLGSGAGPGDVLGSADLLRRQGVEVQPTDRGGAATYHGPGQLVGYPLIDLRCFDHDLGAYLRSLEAALIRTVAGYGIEASSPADETGVWCSDGKLAAIGVRANRWVTSHGFALNVAPELDHFNLLVPCGVPGAPVTSLKALGVDVDLDSVAERFLSEWSSCWNFLPDRTNTDTANTETAPTEMNSSRKSTER